MKKYFLLSLTVFVIFLSGKITAQNNWTVINTGVSSNLKYISFANMYTGWAVADSAILKTTDGGYNWSFQYNPGGVVYWIQSVNDSVVYVNRYYNTILKTTNGGSNWTVINTGAATLCYYLYFADENTGYTAGNTTILKTTNGGSNWNNLNTGTSAWLHYGYFLNASTGWIGSNGGLIIKTTNGGVNWTDYSTGLSGWTYGIFFVDSLTGYAGAGAKVIKTTNGGITWFENFNSIFGGYCQFLSFNDYNTGYFTESSGKIFRTTNAGTNWIIDWSDTLVFPYGIDIPAVYIGYAACNDGKILVRDRTNKAILNSICRPDDGRTQTVLVTLSDSLCQGLIDSVYWYVNDSLVGKEHNITYPFKQGITNVKLKVGNISGFYDSTTATVTRGTFKKYIPGPVFAGLSMAGDSVLYVISTGDKIYRLDINGNPTLNIQVNGNILSSCSVGNDSSIFIGSSDNNLYGFNRYGFYLWPAIPLGGTVSTTPTVDSIQNRIFVGVENGNFAAINKSNGNLGWGTQLDAPIKSSAIISFDRKLVAVTAVGTVYGFNLNFPNPSPPSWVKSLNDSILISPAVDKYGYFYFGSKSGKIYKVAIYGTTNISPIWQTNLGSPVTSSLTIDAYGNLYAGTASGRLYSVKVYNGNINWYFQTDSAIKSTASITPAGRIYFGNNNGEVFGLDTNKNVKFYFKDSSKVSCSMLYHKGTLYYGTETGRLYAFYDTTAGIDYGTKDNPVPMWGTFQNNIRRTGVQYDSLITPVYQVNSTIPDKLKLFQNYPNPFNPQTKISFDIPKKSFVRIQIFDITGREMMQLVNREFEAGSYTIEFNANFLSSGIYFYRMTAGDFTTTLKMAVIK